MSVREQLREEEPLLYDALMRSWDIAHKTWLPAIKPSMGSHAAYPHLHNMEQRLEDLVRAFGDAKPIPFQLSPVEKYLILSAILFHDMGKAVPVLGRLFETDSNTGEDRPLDECHALATWKMLMGGRVEETSAESPSHWAEYGIPSSDLAEIIAKLSLHHDPPKRKHDKEKNEIPSEADERSLSETTLDPYGRVREQGLAALLILLDHLDTSHLRALPSDISTGPKAFRGLIQGVEIDAEGRLVRSVLAKPDRSSEPNKNKPTGNTLDSFYLGGAGFPDCWKDDKPANRQVLMAKAWPDTLLADLEKELGRDGADDRVKKLMKAGLVLLDPGFDTELGNALRALSGFLELTEESADPVAQFGAVKAVGTELERLVGKLESPELEQYHQLATVQADLRTNRNSLTDQKMNLYAIGVMLDGWAVEYDRHLFDDQGRQTIEPILDWDYLKRVAEHMWNLSRKVFGASWFDYERLAAEVRDDRVERVRRAVKRLERLTCDLPHVSCDKTRLDPEEAKRGAIECNDASWKWRVTTSKDSTPCAYVRFKEDVEPCLKDPTISKE